jgi:lysophospholipase L1-like esterase
VEGPFFLQGGERIVFFGDSITQSGRYVEYIEVFLLTRFPEETFEIINRGISSETLSGTSEIDHNPPRPDAHKRFNRDIAPLRPDLLVSCFGMNDGNYRPFSEELFAKYRAGVRRLVKRTAEEAKATLVIMTPPPFDPYRKKISDTDARDWGYKYAFIGYDDVLERYSQWLLTLRNDGLTVADVHTAMNRHLFERRRKKVSFYLSGDGVHPNPTGHWLMAQTLLLTWDAPAQAGSVEIDAGAKRAIEGNVTNLSVKNGIIEFTWRTGLPMPMDPQWDVESIQAERVAERFNRHWLKVTSLSVGRYQLFADERMITKVSREQLAEGLDLLGYPGFPTVERSQEVLTLVQRRQRLVYKTWRKSIEAKDKDLLESAATEAAELNVRARQLCQPKPITLRLVPVTSRSPLSQ